MELDGHELDSILTLDWKVELEVAIHRIAPLVLGYQEYEDMNIWNSFILCGLRWSLRQSFLLLR